MAREWSFNDDALPISPKFSRSGSRSKEISSSGQPFRLFRPQGESIINYENPRGPGRPRNLCIEACISRIPFRSNEVCSLQALWVEQPHDRSSLPQIRCISPASFLSIHTRGPTRTFSQWCPLSILADGRRLQVAAVSKKIFTYGTYASSLFLIDHEMTKPCIAL